VEIVDKILSYFFWKVRSERLQAILFEIWFWAYWKPVRYARRRGYGDV